MRESNDAPYQKVDKRCDMCIFYLIEWNICRRRNGALAGLVDRLPFLPFPFRTDGPQRPVQPRRDVRKQTRQQNSILENIRSMMCPITDPLYPWIPSRVYTQEQRPTGAPFVIVTQKCETYHRTETGARSTCY